jgi:hypothetical protein
MAQVIEDRVLELSTSTGTGAFALAGALSGFRAFSSVCSVADTVWYYIEAIDANGEPSGAYEYGLGTYSSANTLTRTTVRGSSNSGSAVSFAAGNKLVGIGVLTPTAAATKLEWRTALAAAGLGDVNVFTKNQKVTPVALTSSGGSVAIDASLSNNFTHTLTENTTLANPTNLTDGMHLFFRLKQHASSAKTLAFGSKYKFSSTDTHTMPTGLGAVAIMAAYYDLASDTLDCVFNGGTGFA